jgi:nicotinamide phosphoribosyltransferase
MTNPLFSPLLATDSYKVSHAPQYPPGTEKVYSYFESRGGKFPATVFFGLQYLIDTYLMGQVVTQERIDEAAELYGMHFGNDKLFNRAGWQHILDDHDGYLPLEIKAVPEGTIVPVSNVLMTVENTCPQCFWLTNYVETLLVQTWYPTTVATQSHVAKDIIAAYLMKTQGSLDGLEFKLHDFGCRGGSSMETVGLGGAAHLVNFMGTDTVPALVVARRTYGEPIAGFSIPAAEHSTITSWGKDAEADAYANMLTQYPTGLVAVVSDSYDIYNACKTLWGDKLKAQVLGRDGTLVIRPDSGNPTEVVVKVLNILGEAFGYTINDKGYKVLPPQVRVIQGDGINTDSIGHILAEMEIAGWAATNIAFGMGGALLQGINRDTQKFAFKCSQVTVDGQERDVFKQPVTDSGKNSKRGRLALVKDEGILVTAQQSYMTAGRDLLATVFLNGKPGFRNTLKDARARAASGVVITVNV